MSVSPRRSGLAKQQPSNTVYEVTDGLMGVNESFLKAVKSNIQKALMSEDLELPRISSLATRIMQIASAPNVDIDKVVELVQTDVYLAGRVMSLINSAYFATRQEITSLRHAIVLLGAKAVGDLIFCVSIRVKVFKSPVYEGLMNKFWTHSVGAAVATEVLAQTRGRAKDPGFMAGLLHDIGKPTILSAIVDTETKVHPGKHIGEESASMLTEQLHCQVGGLLARKWKLSPDIESAIRDHHTYRDDMPKLTRYVYCGNKIAHHLGLGPRQEELVASTDPAFNAIGLTDAKDLEKILQTVRTHTDRLVGTLASS